MQIVDVSRATFEQIPGHDCLGCTYWHGRGEGNPAEVRQQLFGEGTLRGKLALDEAGAAMGFVQYGLIEVYPEFTKLRAGFGADVLPGTWVITCIMTHKDYRGRGVSKQLIKSVVEEATGEGRAVEAIGMEQANLEQISTGPAELYRAAGFEELGRFRDKYGINVLLHHNPTK